MWDDWALMRLFINVKERDCWHTGAHVVFDVYVNISQRPQTIGKQLTVCLPTVWGRRQNLRLVAPMTQIWLWRQSLSLTFMVYCYKWHIFPIFMQMSINMHCDIIGSPPKQSQLFNFKILSFPIEIYKNFLLFLINGIKHAHTRLFPNFTCQSLILSFK